MAVRKTRGFSLLELMVTVAIIFIVSGITFISVRPVMNDARVNSAYDTVLTQMRNARQRSIEERKRYIVVFGLPSMAGVATPLGAPTAQSIQVFRLDAGQPVAGAVQVLNTELPYDVRFQVISGVPTNPANIPDGFGTGITALDFDQGVAAGATRNLVLFMPDGSSHDTIGNLNSGIMYLARNGDLYSSKSFTVLGTTGRIRGWRLVNGAGGPTWIQQ
jgi:prepilin-type N-terminal cleavage/methylation domain-containing protein